MFVVQLNAGFVSVSAASRNSLVLRFCFKLVSKLFHSDFQQCLKIEVILSIYIIIYFLSHVDKINHISIFFIIIVYLGFKSGNDDKFPKKTKVASFPTEIGKQTERR